MKKISIKEVADKCGFSTATVSRVINKKGGYSAKTEKKVSEAIDSLGYSVDVTAKALRTNVTQTIAVILPDITNEYFALIVREIDSFFYEKGYTVMILDSNENPDLEKKILEDIIKKNVDGLIFLPTQQTNTALKEYPIPIVYVDRNSPGTEYYVISDNEEGGKLAAKELIEASCNEILLIKDSYLTMPIIQRELGFVTYIKENAPNIKIHELKALPEYDSVRDELKLKLLREKYDGIFATNDMMALSAIHTIQSLGMVVPDDIRVVGFDDVSLSRYSFPSITTISQDTSKMGRHASELLLGILSNELVEKKQIIVPVEIKRRESTKYRMKGV